MATVHFFVLCKIQRFIIPPDSIPLEMEAAEDTDLSLQVGKKGDNSVIVSSHQSIY